MNAPLPGPLNDNPQLDRWVAFPAPGKVTVLTGRVELGQGVLTAMAQIAADELDVAIARITDAFRGHRESAKRRIHGRQPIDSIRRCRHAASLRRRAGAVPRTGRQSPRLQVRRIVHSRRQNLSRQHINRAGLLDARRRDRSLQPKRPETEFASASPTLKISARAAPALIFRPRFLAMRSSSTICSSMAWCTPVSCASRTGAQRSARSTKPAIRRAAKGPITFVRNGNFLAIVGDDETAVEAAGVAALNHVAWQNVEAPTADPTGSQLAVAAAGD